MSTNTNSSGRRILIIDDNTSIHRDFAKILLPDSHSDALSEATGAFFGDSKVPSNNLNLQLEFASQGEEGLEKLKQAIEENNPFSMAFVDMRMPPGWDGLTTIKALWEVDSDLQVVICTAYSDHSWSEVRETLGDSDRLLILKKPFDSAEVLQIAISLLEKRRLLDLTQQRTVALRVMVEERTQHLTSALDESERLVEAIDSVLIELNAQGCILRWNHRAREVFNLQADDVLGKPFETLEIAWEEGTCVSDLMAGKNLKREFTFASDLGSKRFIELSVHPIRQAHQYQGALILGSDLTEQKHLESQLHQAQKLESVGQLAAGVAHEINTPMQYVGDNLDFLEKKVSAMSGFLEQIDSLAQADPSSKVETEKLRELFESARKLKAKKASAALLEAIDDSREGVRHVSKIVRAMKEFAHPGQEEKMPVDINRALESTVTVSTNEWKYAARVEFDLEPSLPTVQALSVELNQVFLNILINAAHAIEEANAERGTAQGVIRIGTKTIDDCVEVTISDTGTGIPDSVKKHIFDPFFTTKEVGKGTGQGLSIAHGVVVKQHGGQLWCDSQPGLGTTFFLRLPLEGSPMSTDTASPTENLVEGVS